MKKEYDVHFEVVFHDMYVGIEAASKKEAEQIISSELYRKALIQRILYLLDLGEDEGYEVKLTDTLEVGTDI